MRRKSIDDLLEETRRALRRLRPTEAFEASQRGATLIDTRSEDEIKREGRVPTALHLPLNVLEWRVDPDSAHRDPRVPGTEHRLILICKEGFSSSLAAGRLQVLGFMDATDVIGGFDAWKQAGLPVESTK